MNEHFGVMDMELKWFIVFDKPRRTMALSMTIITYSDSCILCTDCPCNVAQSNSLQVDGVLVILKRLL